MSERNPSTNTPALVLVALIGAIGVIFAACIGLIPTILPLVRSTATPSTLPVFATGTSLPTDTPTFIPETATPTLTSTELPTLTATLEPLPTDTPITETPTITVTSIPPSSDLEAYMGLWVNVDDEPSSDKVRLVLSRIDITQTGDATANFSVCRSTRSGDRFVNPNPNPASIYVLGLGAGNFVISSNPDLRWAIVVQRTADQLVATVQEYDLNNILLNTDTYNMEKASLLDPETLLPCREPTTDE